jgi:hypothetical protein
MVTILRAFADKAGEISSRQFLELLNTPSGRHAMGIISGPWSESPDSELMCSPYEIAVSLLEEIGLDLTPILGAKPSSSPDAPAWHCILKLPVFSEPVSSGVVSALCLPSWENLRRNYGHRNIRRADGRAQFVEVNNQTYIGCPTSGVAQRAMREAVPHARGVGKARQL